MQCFQKDPNLRVSAKKLLKHAWIVSCRKAADAPVAKAPANFSQAVEEVKQWNKALNSSDPHVRMSSGSDFHPSARVPSGTPAKGPLSLKPRTAVEAFKAAELDDDNWDNDFATAISPSALQLPHLRPQDNFGGLLSGDKLKAFASNNDTKAGILSYDDDFEGELLTIKGTNQNHDDAQDRTIRPIARKPPKIPEQQHRGHQRAKSIPNKISTNTGQSYTQSPAKSALGNKFELPVSNNVIHRERSIEDYSDLFVDNESIFNQKFGHVCGSDEPCTLFTR